MMGVTPQKGAETLMVTVKEAFRVIDTTIQRLLDYEEQEAVEEGIELLKRLLALRDYARKIEY